MVSPPVSITNVTEAILLETPPYGGGITRKSLRLSIYHPRKIRRCLEITVQYLREHGPSHRRQQKQEQEQVESIAHPGNGS
jgi:hypothetical protein